MTVPASKPSAAFAELRMACDARCPTYDSLVWMLTRPHTRVRGQEIPGLMVAGRSSVSWGIRLVRHVRTVRSRN